METVKAALPLSKGERRLRNKVRRASERREKLLDKGKLSLPSGQGILSIIVSDHEVYPDVQDVSLTKKNHAVRIMEAERIKDERMSEHQAVEIRPKAVISDMRMIFADEEVTDILLIGHGTIGSLITGNPGKHYSWQDAAKDTRRLKQGKIEQWSCGHFPKELKYSVPLGTFAVSNIMNVEAALGEQIEQPAEGERWGHLFAPVYRPDIPLLDQIEAFNHSFSTSSRQTEDG